MKKIAVMGSGSWGIALALLLNKNGHEIKIWSHTKNEADEINLIGENKNCLPGIKIPKEILISNDDKLVLYDVDFVIIAIPSKFIRETLQKFSIPEDAIIINVSKGIEEKTFLRISEIIEQVTQNNKIVTLAGPTHAEEVSRNLPTTCVAASKDIKLAKDVQKLFNSEFFRVYTTSDIIGVELGSALKNIIALASGIADGLNFGDNTKAAIITRGILEIVRLGEKLGAKPETFYGLSGIGDLVVTCISNYSRNRRAGILLGQGVPLNETLKKVNMVVEGVSNTKAVNDLAKKLGVDMPIVFEINKMLYEGKSSRQSVLDLMLRNPKDE